MNIPNGSCETANSERGLTGRSATQLFVEQTMRDTGVRVDTAVAKERPMLAGFLNVAEVAFGDDDFFGVVAGAGDDFAEWIANEGAAPELDSAFETDAVGDSDEHAIGDGVSALDGDPGVVLFGAEPVFLAEMPADGGWIENDLGAFQSGEPRGFRIPLIPADQRADGGARCGERLEAEVARREIEFFVVERVVGYVHLAIAPDEPAAGVDDDGGVVVEAGGTFFEDRADDGNAVFAGGVREGGSGRAGDGFREGELGMVLGLAKVERAEEFRQANDVRAALGRFGDEGERVFEVGGGLRGTAHLDEADGDRMTFGAHAEKGGKTMMNFLHCCKEFVFLRNGNQTTATCILFHRRFS